MAKKKELTNRYVGMVCQKGNSVELCNSPAGYYLGTFDEDGPCCRLSTCVPASQVSSLVPDRICEENLFCNGGRGCRLCEKPESSIRFVQVQEVCEATFAVVADSDAEACALVQKAYDAGEVVFEEYHALDISVLETNYNMSKSSLQEMVSDDSTVSAPFISEKLISKTDLLDELFSTEGRIIGRDASILDWIYKNFGIYPEYGA